MAGSNSQGIIFSSDSYQNQMRLRSVWSVVLESSKFSKHTLSSNLWGVPPHFNHAPLNGEFLSQSFPLHPQHLYSEASSLCSSDASLSGCGESSVIHSVTAHEPEAYPDLKQCKAGLFGQGGCPGEPHCPYPNLSTSDDLPEEACLPTFQDEGCAQRSAQPANRTNPNMRQIKTSLRKYRLKAEQLRRDTQSKYTMLGVLCVQRNLLTQDIVQRLQEVHSCRLLLDQQRDSNKSLLKTIEQLTEGMDRAAADASEDSDLLPHRNLTSVGYRERNNSSSNFHQGLLRLDRLEARMMITQSLSDCVLGLTSDEIDMWRSDGSAEEENPRRETSAGLSWSFEECCCSNASDRLQRVAGSENGLPSCDNFLDS